MMRSLFWKVYLTLLAALLLVTVAMGFFVRLAFDDEAANWRERRADLVMSLLPADATRSDMHRLARGLRADIAIYDPDGRRSLSVGGRFPRHMDEISGADADHHRGGQASQIHRHPLDDGRTVVARFDGALPFQHRPQRGPLIGMVLIAAVIGLAAFPVIRHVTRRLERLQGAVDQWGDGDLVARVAVEGRDEVARVADSFNRAAAKIEKLLAAHRSLLANASHELRSPLARLRVAVDLYEAEAAKTGSAPALRREILRSVEELDALVEEILLASRLDHIGALESRAAVDLVALLAEEGARVGIDIEGGDAVVDGDARLLRRLIRNLLANAVRHGAPPIEARAGRSNGTVQLTVRDHGPGVPDADRERLFEAFYRPQGHGETAGGWGLGLALVRQIAERHGGSVRYDPVPGGGALFTVVLPAAISVQP